MIMSATAASMVFPARHRSFPLKKPPNPTKPNASLRFISTVPAPTPTIFKVRVWPCPNPKGRLAVHCSSRRSPESQMDSPPIDCVGTGTDVECVVSVSASDKDGSDADPLLPSKGSSILEIGGDAVVNTDGGLIGETLDWGLMISPFFFWGTAMVAMKEVILKAGPFFDSSFRLIPAGLLLIGFASFKGREQPSGVLAWVSILLFAVIDAACFQGFLAEGLQKTSAGLGVVGAAGLVLGVIGLLLLEVPAISFDGSNSTIWGSGEWWMFLAAQSMAVGTVMVRWVSKYSDPVMATGWHMVLGGFPLLAISMLNHDPAFNGGLKELSSSDLLALLYTSLFGSAISYGVYFYNATRGSLTRLSSLTFLTPMFASVFGFIYLDETFTPIQLAGAVVTVFAIYMVNYKKSTGEG